MQIVIQNKDNISDKLEAEIIREAKNQAIFKKEGYPQSFYCEKVLKVYNIYKCSYRIVYKVDHYRSPKLKQTILEKHFQIVVISDYTNTKKSVH